MATFTLRELINWGCKCKVFCLGINGKFPYDEFIQEIKKDKNLDPELGDLMPIVKYFADGKIPFLPKKKLRKLELGKKTPFSVYEAKSHHLRLYFFKDKETGVILLCGGKKADQPRDVERIKRHLKGYHVNGDKQVSHGK